MRIISGTARGTKLYTLEGQATRPTLDRVKESLFNIMQNKIPNSIFLDLFSGSGAIGLEAASRGAEKAILCDKSKDAIKIINKNIEKTHLREKTEIYNLDYELVLKTKIKKHIDIVYIDPPYDSDFAIKSIKQIVENNLIDENSIMIIETDNDKKLLENLKKIEVEITDKRKYGRAVLIFLKIRKG